MAYVLHNPAIRRIILVSINLHGRERKRKKRVEKFSVFHYLSLFFEIRKNPYWTTGLDAEMIDSSPID